MASHAQSIVTRGRHFARTVEAFSSGALVLSLLARYPVTVLLTRL